MNILGSERVVTQNFTAHQNVAEDYSGNHLSDIKIFGNGKVISVINKYKPFEDAINYDDYLKYKNDWKDGNYYNCVSITGKKVRYNQSELGGNEIWIECYYDNSKRYLRFNHLAEVLVNVGDIIDSNTVIGKQGNTGLVLSNKPRTDSTYGSHVHFEVRDENYAPLNPRSYAEGKITVNYLEQSNSIDETKNQIKIIADKINIRESFSINSKDIGDVYRNEIYTVLDLVDDTQYIWYKITTNLNKTGYIASLKGGNWTEIINKSEPIVIVDENKEDNNSYKLLFECERDGLYAVRLKAGEKLYIS